MKTVGRIVSIFLLVVASLLSLVFAFVEFRVIFVGEFSLLENPAMGFFQYGFRAFYFLLLISFCAILMIHHIRKKPFSFYHYLFAITLLVASFAAIFFYVNAVYFAVIGIALLPFIALIIGRFVLA